MKWQVKLLKPIWSQWLAVGMKTVPEGPSISKAHVSQCFGNIPQRASCMSIFQRSRIECSHATFIQRVLFLRHCILLPGFDLCFLHKYCWMMSGKKATRFGHNFLPCAENWCQSIGQTPGIPDTTHPLIDSSSITSAWPAGELKAFCEVARMEGWIPLVVPPPAAPLPPRQERARLHVNPRPIKTEALQNPGNLFLFWLSPRLLWKRYVAREKWPCQHTSRQKGNCMFFSWLLSPIHRKSRACGSYAKTVMCQQGISGSYYRRLWRDALSEGQRWGMLPLLYSVWCAEWERRMYLKELRWRNRAIGFLAPCNHVLGEKCLKKKKKKQVEWDGVRQAENISRSDGNYRVAVWEKIRERHANRISQLATYSRRIQNV